MKKLKDIVKPKSILAVQVLEQRGFFGKLSESDYTSEEIKEVKDKLLQ